MTGILFLDACVLINLAAAGEMAAILRASNAQVFICTAVQTETLYVRSGDPESPDVVPIDLAPLIASCSLQVVSLATETEEELFVDLAASLEDGEAMTIALAIARGAALATDDRKARRIFGEITSDQSRLFSTSDLVRNWARLPAVASTDVKRVVTRIRSGARFVPAEDDPNYAWWIALIPSP